MSDELWHYTTAEGFKGIIESQKLWATHAKYLNDSSELIHALTYWDLEDSNKNKIKEQLFEKTLFEKFDPFILSFSSNQPEDGLLSQWRGYGEYAIVFDQNLVLKSIKNKLPSDEGAALEANAVWYDKKNVLKEKSYDLIYSTLDKHVTAILNKEIVESKAIWEKDEPDLMEQFLRILLRSKNPGFSEEKEFRCIYIKKQECVALPIKFRLGKEELIPYVEISYSVDTIKKIVIGPHPNQEKRVNSAKMFLKLMGLSEIDVVNSRIPYIGY